MTRELSASTDLGTAGMVAAACIGLSFVLLLGYELYRARSRGRAAWLVASTGVLASLSLVGAVLRPVSIETDGISVGPRLLVLLDGSRSMDLPAESGRRRGVLGPVARGLAARSSEAREVFLMFGEGPAAPTVEGSLEEEFGPRAGRPGSRSDLTAALEAVARSGDEPPTAIVVVSDGRLDRPSSAHAGDRGALGLGSLDVPVHTVSVTRRVPRDASIRSVSVAGAAVAHQPLSLRIEVGCSGGLQCDDVPVVARELADKGTPEVLARGEASAPLDGASTLELGITLHRAGPRVIEVAIESPRGDEISDNDRRFVTLDVARDRVRVLHVAGRPTYDVRALRMWLKGDASVDVVAFFILRTVTDNLGAPSSELALIPFPVDELFSVHLPSFDAVVLQDFNADIYGLTKHLGTLARYVEGGGGLIMVGGPDAFGPGKYAASPLAEVLPVQLGAEHEAKGLELGWFTPSLTRVGRVAPVLGPLRDVIGDAFPEMPGTNLVGDATPGATVLLTHAYLKTPSGAPMPVLSLGEYGTGRTIALTVDGSHRLLFSSFAAAQAGRAHGAFWDGLLGWLMRDPRFEATVVDLPSGCIAGEENELVLRPLPGTEGEAKVSVMALGSGETVFEKTAALAGEGQPTKITLAPLPPGGYAASVQIGKLAVDAELGKTLTPATRRDFACERGGAEWADPRPDPERLAQIAEATGGVAVEPDTLDRIPLPSATHISTQRKATPILPAWGWTAIAGALLGAHWIARRRTGLA